MIKYQSHTIESIYVSKSQHLLALTLLYRYDFKKASKDAFETEPNNKFQLKFSPVMHF